MVRVRYRGGYSFTHNEHGELEEGDVVDVGEYTAEQFDGMFVRVDEESDLADESAGDADGDDGGSDDDEADTATDAPVAPGEFAVDELRDHLAEADYSAGELDALESAERDGKGRTTALDAIDDAREE